MKRIMIEIGIQVALSVIGVLQGLVTRWLESKKKIKTENEAGQ